MKPTTAERAYLMLRDLIVTTSLPPGSVIQEAELMEELQLGRTPIREAIKRLQADELVAIQPRRGMFVTDITATDLTQIFEVRLQLEGTAARLAAQRITPAELKLLGELGASYRGCTDCSATELLDLDQQFHSALASASHNRFLQQDLDKYYHLSLRIWYMAMNQAQPEDIDVDAHLRIIKTIQAHDVEGAEQQMRRHIEKFHQTIRKYL